MRPPQGEKVQLSEEVAFPSGPPLASVGSVIGGGLASLGNNIKARVDYLGSDKGTPSQVKPQATLLQLNDKMKYTETESTTQEYLNDVTFVPGAPEYSNDWGSM